MRRTSGSADGWATMKSLPPVSPTIRGYERYDAMLSPICFHRPWKTARGSGEVDACQVRVGHRDVGHRLAVAGHHVDDARRETRLLEQQHEQVRGVLLRRRGLPHDGVAHQRRSGRQVAGDGGEVEGRDRVDEALERAMVGAVPHPRRRDRLLGEDAAREVHVEAPEVDQLTGRVDLRLDRGLGLAEHRRGVERRPPRAGEQIGGLEQDGSPVVERQRTPVRGGGLCRVDRRAGVLVGGAPHGPEHVVPVVRLDDLDLLAAAEAVLTADRHGQLAGLAGHPLEGALELGALGAARGVLPDRLVDRGGDLGDGVHVRHGATVQTARLRVVSDGRSPAVGMRVRAAWDGRRQASDGPFPAVGRLLSRRCGPGSERLWTGGSWLPGRSPPAPLPPSP